MSWKNIFLCMILLWMRADVMFSWLWWLILIFLRIKLTSRLSWAPWYQNNGRLRCKPKLLPENQNTPQALEHKGDGWANNWDASDLSHWRLNCLLNHLFKCWSKKTSNLRITGLCEGNPQVTGGFPSKMAGNAENIFVWWSHHSCRIASVTITWIS